MLVSTWKRMKISSEIESKINRETGIERQIPASKQQVRSIRIEPSRLTFRTIEIVITNRCNVNTTYSTPAIQLWACHLVGHIAVCVNKERVDGGEKNIRIGAIKELRLGNCQTSVGCVNADCLNKHSVRTENSTNPSKNLSAPVRQPFRFVSADILSHFLMSPRYSSAIHQFWNRRSAGENRPKGMQSPY